jgi:hypothetical protein
MAGNSYPLPLQTMKHLYWEDELICNDTYWPDSQFCPCTCLPFMKVALLFYACRKTLSLRTLFKLSKKFNDLIIITSSAN